VSIALEIEQQTRQSDSGMKKRCLGVTLAGLMLSGSILIAQMLPQPPKEWVSVRPIVDSPGSQELQTELLDTNILALIEKHVGITADDASNIVVAPEAREVQIYLLKEQSQEAYHALVIYLMEYSKARLDGHTKECLYAALTNQAAPTNIADSDLRDLATNLIVLPPTWFRRNEAGSITNFPSDKRRIVHQEISGNTGSNAISQLTNIVEITRSVAFDMVDGRVAWRYEVEYGRDGKFFDVSQGKVDAKELDPNFKAVLEEVNQAVEAEMRRSGTFGKFGSIHSFWGLKKKKLKERGIDWMSPEDLNLNTIYD
jgi:hypothetical protein